MTELEMKIMQEMRKLDGEKLAMALAYLSEMLGRPEMCAADPQKAAEAV